MNQSLSKQNASDCIILFPPFNKNHFKERESMAMTESSFDKLLPDFPFIDRMKHQMKAAKNLLMVQFATLGIIWKISC